MIEKVSGSHFKCSVNVVCIQPNALRSHPSLSFEELNETTQVGDLVLHVWLLPIVYSPGSSECQSQDIGLFSQRSPF